MLAHVILKTERTRWDHSVLTHRASDGCNSSSWPLRARGKAQGGNYAHHLLKGLTTSPSGACEQCSQRPPGRCKQSRLLH